MADNGAVHHLDGGSAALDAAAPVFSSQLVSAGGDVHGNAVVRVYGIGRRLGPPQTQLLLGGEDEIEIVFARLELLHRQQQDHAGDAVVHIGRDQPVSGGKGGGIVDCGVSDLYHGLGLIGVMGADINIEVIQGHLLGLHPLIQGNQSLYAIFEPDGGMQDAVGMQAAHLAKAEKTLLLHVCYDTADGVHMGAEQHAGARPLFMADQISHHVGAALVHIGGGQFLEGGGDLSFVAGGAVTGIEGLKRMQNIHDTSSYWLDEAAMASMNFRVRVCMWSKSRTAATLDGVWR